MGGRISSLLFSTAQFLRKVGKNISSEDRARNELLRNWREGNKVHDYRHNYPDLSSESVVLDLGGYKGDWASHIYSQHLSKIYVFEPHPEFFQAIQTRFKKNNAIQIFNYGLGASDHIINLGTDADASSAFHASGKTVTGKIKEFGTFLIEQNLGNIDLIKINIEGGEYDLLEYVLDKQLTGRVKNFQIQFHDFVPDAKSRMKRIQERLGETHSLTYNFPFFWENWERN